MKAIVIGFIDKHADDNGIKFPGQKLESMIACLQRIKQERERSELTPDYNTSMLPRVTE